VRLSGIPADLFEKKHFITALEKAKNICGVISDQTRKTREKDFTDHFRSFIYDSAEEMNAVLGTIKEDETIESIAREAEEIREAISGFIGE
jgi:hypothetical protein